ncbi:MAG TPA: DMT family transporter [Vicinamibacterales bacterium]|jgi:drug/metabolite transporter (DMT)-like permease|nr:DMT family transporter [Vicinamibacterales bacterium]
MLYLLALLGVLGISFSAIFVRLANVSPITATFFRTAYAVPVLALVWAVQSRARARRGLPPRAARERVLAFVSGLILAADLILWHESIALVGAGLGTVIANVQVVFVAIAAWALYGDRPSLRTWSVIAVILVGIALTSGFNQSDAYGSNPPLGVIVGLIGGVVYGAFLLVFRAANLSLAPPAGPLLDSTIGGVVGAMVCAIFDPHFVLLPTWPAHLWLVLLALTSQVMGWLLIATALPRLPSVETSILLLGQPIFTVIWGLMIFDERLSMLQWSGSALVLAGVTVLSVSRARQLSDATALG